jgi:hypothetical protein
MRQAYEEQRISSTYNEMSFDDRLTFLLQREVTERDNKALQSRLGKAKFKATGAIEEIQTSASRGLDKTLLLQLSQCGCYACHDFQGMLEHTGLEASMSRSGCCYDNAVMESFFHSLKVEFVHHENSQLSSRRKMQFLNGLRCSTTGNAYTLQSVTRRQLRLKKNLC